LRGARIEEAVELNTQTDWKRHFIELMQSRQAVIGIVGMGYVGQPLALRYSQIGFKVLGFDVDLEKIHQLNNGHSAIEYIDDEVVSAANSAGMSVTSDFSRVGEADAVILCVPTPLNKNREPDLGFVIASCDSISPYLRPGQVVSLESTTYPGTTEEEVLPRIEANGLVVGETIFAVYSPEREDPGNAHFTTNTIPKVVGGHTKACLEAGTALYQPAIDHVVQVSSTRCAEMTKLLENIHRAVNIGLVNEMKIVADRMGIDIFEVIDAAATKPFGFAAYYPGPGLGGHCIPIDPFYLTWKARQYGINTKFIELSGEINRAMPEYVFGKLVSALNSVGKPVKDAKILVLGIAYKKDVGDVRESPALPIMEYIRTNGGNLAYSDPHVPTFPKMREHSFDLSSTVLTPQSIADFDVVVLTTNHKKFDFEMIRKNARLIVDSRGVYRDAEPHVVRA
jgi:UDP-N-acetyl-D-glucosamine dehydrogenase